MPQEKLPSRGEASAKKTPVVDAAPTKRPASTDPAKQPGFAAQEAALKPAAKAAKAPAGATSAAFAFSAVRLNPKGMSEADVTVSWLESPGSNKPIAVETITVRFRGRAVDHDSASSLQEAFMKGGHLDAQKVPADKHFDISQKLFMAALMAVRDPQICKTAGTSKGG